MNMKLVINRVNDVALDNIVIPNIDHNPSLDQGEVATLSKRCRNTSPLKRPPRVGHIIHYDIAHGTGTSIGVVCL